MKNFIFSPSQGLFVKSDLPFTFLPDEATKLTSENANLLLTSIKQSDAIVVASEDFIYETFDEVTVRFAENLLSMDGSDCADFAELSLGMSVTYEGGGVWMISDEPDQSDDGMYSALLPVIQNLETKNLIELFNREFDTQVYYDGAEGFLVKYP